MFLKILPLKLFRKSSRHLNWNRIHNYTSIVNNETSNQSTSPGSQQNLSHVNIHFLPQMVDVSQKNVTSRKARAQAIVELPADVVRFFSGGDIQTKKGPVFATAIVAGTLAAKQTHLHIPFCHQIPLESCKIDIRFNDNNELLIESEVSAHHKTGVEMEALTAVSLAALTVYDMCKSISHHIVIKNIRLLEKRGGKSDLDHEKSNEKFTNKE